MFPDGVMLASLYVNTRATPEECSAARDFMKKFPDEASAYNIMDYMSLQVKKDTAEAEQYFEK
ncbi:hypothetical protein FW778_17885 [Ginsengibacter hankyongi]|uniref:Uncharacterized protein n=1 Tax=Ginsengibacter hankyongi TaxID=2607284 RepID=A0A5J5IDR0_9BACT|nr:hypothetical protein [Ginsengibacter hankyongi]KAA9037296.1 hypothetical protein FW778_17885 [Ginsengibacter hankyongi]